MIAKSPRGGAGRKFLKLPVPVLILWLMAAMALPVWVMHDSSAWDVGIYGKAMQSLQAGHDPYSDAIIVQQQHHRDLLAHHIKTDDAPPYSYVYSPITLPLLRALNRIPLTLLLALYWSTYAAGVIAAIAVGVSLGESSERRVLLYWAGVAAFFPGLLANGVLLSGNIAYILYGAVLLTALLGWKRNRWLPFYVAVVLASCVKAPFLSFALVAPLSARRQWWPTAATVATGLVLFGMQPSFGLRCFGTIYKRSSCNSATTMTSAARLPDCSVNCWKRTACRMHRGVTSSMPPTRSHCSPGWFTCHVAACAVTSL